MTHTPGPWEIDATSNAGDWEVWAGSMDKNAPLICQCSHELTDPYWETHAAESIGNARLIAAAPDMLAALKLVIHRPDSWPEIEPGALVELAVRTRDAVRAAIARAEGSKP